MIKVESIKTNKIALNKIDSPWSEISMGSVPTVISNSIIKSFMFNPLKVIKS